MTIGARIIVPLAGPDFVRSDGKLKSLVEVDGEPFLLKVLRSRPWYASASPCQYTFVMRDLQVVRNFAEHQLLHWFPGCKTVFLNHLTHGAALSIASALGYETRTSTLVIVDLADIIYEADEDPFPLFASRPNLGGLAMTFPDQNPIYSYLQFDEDGQFVRAAEKKVISTTASAGTYMFSSGAVLHRAIAHALDHYGEMSHKGNLFVCPLLNGVHDQGLDVACINVKSVNDLKGEWA